MSGSSEAHMLPWSHMMWLQQQHQQHQQQQQQQQQQINMLQQALLLGGTAGPRRARNRPARPGRAERERQHAPQKVWSGAAAELGGADVSAGQSIGSQIHDASQGARAAPQSKSDAESWCEVDAETSKVSLMPE
eukprot:5668102-Amphidinium_carterae.2